MYHELPQLQQTISRWGETPAEPFSAVCFVFPYLCVGILSILLSN